MDTENTGIRLKKLMKIKNIRQIDILNAAQPYCKKYNVKLNKSDLSQYLSNKAIPGQKKLKILSLALNISPAWLMGYNVPMEDNSENSTTDNINRITVYAMNGEKAVDSIDVNEDTIEEIAELVNVANQLPKEKIKALINTANAMK